MLHREPTSMVFGWGMNGVTVSRGLDEGGKQGQQTAHTTTAGVGMRGGGPASEVLLIPGAAQVQFIQIREGDRMTSRHPGPHTELLGQVQVFSSASGLHLTIPQPNLLMRRQ